MTKAAVYARKSTAQDGPAETRSVARQVSGAKKWIESKGWTLEESHIFVDDGVSGTLFEGRPDFQRMLRAAEARSFDYVVIYDLDRLGRDGFKTTVTLHDLADNRVGVVEYPTSRFVDLKTSEGRILETFRGEFAQQFKDAIRKKTSDALRRKAELGHVVGKAPFGYINSVDDAGVKIFTINKSQARVVKGIYNRYAAGEGVASITRRLNATKTPPPRKGVGWSETTVKRLLRQPLYRGVFVYGVTKIVQGREGADDANWKRETAQEVQPVDSRVVRDKPELRIIDVDIIDRVDARIEEARELYEGRKKGKKPHTARGHFLLSGGLLKCPDCGSNFEARNGTSWRGRGVYICATRRRAPGACPNRLVLPLDVADSAMLNVLEDVVLGGKLVAELLDSLDAAPVDEVAMLTDQRDKLRAGVDNMVASIAAGVPAKSIAATVKDYERQIVQLEVKINRPRPVQMNREKLRAALEQRQKDWRETLRGEIKIARMLIRRLIGPIKLWHDEATPGFVKKGDTRGQENIGPNDVRFDVEVKRGALLEGLDGGAVPAGHSGSRSRGRAGGNSRATERLRNRPAARRRDLRRDGVFASP